VAAKLGRTVAELRATMDSDEFMHWSIFYARDAQRKDLAAKMAG
jgi:hypothetical protein